MVSALPKAARQPLHRALSAVRSLPTGSFAAAEPHFLGAMWEFDQLVADGTADQGDIQNGKGDFFNDVLVELLEKASGKKLHTRPGVPGLSFKRNKLDVCYPASGPVELMVETKATGIPKHPRNTSQKNPEGRAASADLDKRIKEAAFKNIDIKGEMARLKGVGGGATSDLANWLAGAPPRSYIFFACRVRDERDRKKCEEQAHVAAIWFAGCGLYCYGKNKNLTGYESKSVHAALELDRVLSQVATALRTLK